MKFLVKFCVILCYIGYLQAQSNEFKARRAARRCVFEHKVDYSVAMKFSKGDMSDDSDKAKCFLKCFAYTLGLFSNKTGRPQKEVLLQYTNYLPEPDLPYGDIIDTCNEKTQPGDDECDYIYRGYKCIWDEVRNQPEPESLRFSLYDVFGFNKLYDEAEIKAEEEARLQEEALKAEVETPEIVKEELNA